MISKYETLAKVVELGSLTRAAEALGCTQSAVSHAINGLEKEFGFAVLTRSRAGVHLTADGERIMPSIRGMLNYEEQLKQTVSAIRGLDFGTVRIGAFTSVAVHWLPGVIKEFQRDYPNVDIKLLNGDYHDVEQWIMEGSVDLGFVHVPAGLSCECVPLMEDRLLAIFDASEEMLRIGVPALRIISLSFPIAGFCIGCGSVFQALGYMLDVYRGEIRAERNLFRYALFVSFFPQLAVLIPCAYLIGRLTGNVTMIWWAFVVAELFSLLLSSIFYRRINERVIKAM